MSMVYRKDIYPDGLSGKKAPCMLYGYGSYGASIEPSFDFTRLILLAAARVFGGCCLSAGFPTPGGEGRGTSGLHILEIPLPCCISLSLPVGLSILFLVFLSLIAICPVGRRPTALRLWRVPFYPPPLSLCLSLSPYWPVHYIPDCSFCDCPICRRPTALRWRGPFDGGCTYLRNRCVAEG